MLSVVGSLTAIFHPWAIPKDIAPYKGVIVFDELLHYRADMKKGQGTYVIAIVDDDESVQRALQETIEADGFSARCFGSAEEFLESGVQRKMALLITDIRMPGMSGLELQAKLKADLCKAPIIFITAH